MTPKKIFRAKQIEQQLLKHPNIPYAESFCKKYSDNNANNLTAMVIEWLRMEGHQAERISNTGRYVITKGEKDEVFNRNFDTGKYIPSTGVNGTADISATIKGFSVKLEVKFGKDRQSDDQKKYEASVKAAGGIYYIVRDFDTFFDWYQNLIDKLKNFSLNL